MDTSGQFYSAIENSVDEVLLVISFPSAIYLLQADNLSKSVQAELAFEFLQKKKAPKYIKIYLSTEYQSIEKPDKIIIKKKQ